MATVIIKSTSSDNQAIVNSDGRLLVSTDGSGGGNASVGMTGDAAPTSGTEIAGINPDGDLQGLSVDADGKLNISGTTTTTITNIVTTSQEGLNSFKTSQYTVGTSAQQITPIPLPNRSSMSLRVSADTGSAIYIGDSASLTLSNGYPLFDGDTLQMDLTASNTIYAISDAPGQTLFVLEIA